MTKAEKLEREIQVIKEIIRILKACFWLHFENFQVKESLETFRDLQKCTKELNKLNVAKKAELGATKETANNVTQNRSGETFS